jgi:hypothetical protein
LEDLIQLKLTLAFAHAIVQMLAAAVDAPFHQQEVQRVIPLTLVRNPALIQAADQMVTESNFM